MEYVTFKKDIKKYNIKKGERLPVWRNIMWECVVCTGNERMNYIVSESALRRYGELTGIPQLYI